LQNYTVNLINSVKFSKCFKLHQIQKAMKINFIHKIQHIGIPVHCMEVSIPFYERLGFENVMESPLNLMEDLGLA